MISTLLIYSLTVFFLFYLVNHADLFDKVRLAVIPSLPHWLSYPIQCAFCACFWITLSLWYFNLADLWLVFTAPPVTLLLNLIFLKLKSNGQ
jgi:hypothetical protein